MSTKIQTKNNQIDNVDSISMSRNLYDLNFFELKVIAGRLTGKKATVANIAEEGAIKNTKEFSLKNCDIAIAANLIMCSKGQHKMMCNISKAIGDEEMKKLTVTTPAIKLFELVQNAGLDSNQFAYFLSAMATRQREISKAEVDI
jgi:hypothetical protein